MYLVCTIKRGLLLSDLENMTIGMALDYFEEYDNISNPDREKTFIADQEDYNSF